MDLRPEDVEEIISLLDSLAQDEFEIRTSELHLVVRRAGDEGWTQEARVLTEPNVVPDPAMADAAVADAAVADPLVADPLVADPAPEPAGAPEGTVADPVPAGLVGVRAPLPGTFYRAPKPGARPYVEVGDRVAEDAVVGLLETMKLFTSVAAGVRGEVVEFRVDDAEPAGQDAVLVLVRPDVPPDADPAAEG